VGSIEGSRFYNINGEYYIFNNLPANTGYVLKSSSPWGPYTQKLFESNIAIPIPGGGIPHQGGIVGTPNGDWYYMAVMDSYPGGRVPGFAPITFGSDGFTVITTVNGGWRTSYPYPMTPQELASPTGTDSFQGTSLGPPRPQQLDFIPCKQRPHVAHNHSDERPVCGSGYLAYLRTYSFRDPPASHKIIIVNLLSDRVYLHLLTYPSMV
jgi:hypothetical protein